MGECAKLKAALPDEAGANNLKQRLADAQARKAEIAKAAADQTAEIEALKAKLAELKTVLADEKQGRKDDKLEYTRLLTELDAVNAEKADLEAEMALIVDQIGFLSEYSSKKAK